MIERVKTALRVKTTSLDLEITDLIDACKADLSISGVEIIDDSDPLIQRAIIVYCKANFGLNNVDSEKYQKSYDLLKQHLALCSDYKEVIT